MLDHAPNIRILILMTKQFRITFTGGRADSICETIEEAHQEILSMWPEAFFYENDDRELAWANEEDSENDDGCKAIASIWFPEQTRRAVP